MQQSLKSEVLFQLLPRDVQDLDGLDCRGSWDYTDIAFIKLMPMTLSSSKQQSKAQQLKLDRLKHKIGCAFLTVKDSYLSAMQSYTEVPISEH